MTRPKRPTVGFTALALLALSCADAAPAPTAQPATSAMPPSSAARTSSAGPSTGGIPAAETSVPAMSPPTTGDDTVRPEGFTLVTATATSADGTVCALCLWAADTSAERARGLMGVTDLGGADGMAFLYDETSSGSFYMFGTPMPLSIAFFAPDGTFVSSADMEPCFDASVECPRYPADGQFSVAVEVPAGELAELGIGPGSRIDVGGEVANCPVDDGGETP